MDEPKNTGGPAFLASASYGTYVGVSVRDYFAAQAMQGLMSGPSPRGSLAIIAKVAYDLADQMMIERAR